MRAPEWGLRATKFNRAYWHTTFVILSARRLERIVTGSFGIQKHDTVLITGPAKWMNAVAIECERVGASRARDLAICD